MTTNNDDIFVIMKDIRKTKLELDEVNAKFSDNRFKCANIKSELFILYSQLDEIQKEEKLRIKTRGSYNSIEQLNTPIDKVKSFVKRKTLIKK